MENQDAGGVGNLSHSIGQVSFTTDQASLNQNVTDIGFHEPTEEEMRHSLFIFYIVLFVMIFAQSALVNWRKTHRRSYDLVTLMGLWLVPPIASVFGQFWKFLMAWIVYTAVTGYFLYRCTFGKTIDKTLPKTIYRWFSGIFKISVFVGMAGYILLLVGIFGAGIAPQQPLLNPGFALTLLWYGLYFGILTRDCAEVASDRIASRLGGVRRMAVSVRDCAICGNELTDGPLSSGSNGANTPREPSVQLSCKHLFHNDCMRGWLIIGKKDSCPTCNEKVDLRALYRDKPWETTNLSWIQMLDFFRYMVVWQPTILLGLHFALLALHLDDVPAGSEMPGGDALNLTASNSTAIGDAGASR